MSMLDNLKELGPKIDHILSDGNWHTFAEFLELGECISGEIASRKFISCTHKEQRDKAKSRPIMEQIEQGRRNILSKKLNDKARIGEIIKRGTGYDRQYKKAQQTKSVEEKSSDEPFGIEQFTIRMWGDLRKRSDKVGFRLEYDANSFYFRRGESRITFSDLKQVSAFLDGIEWSD